MSEAEDRGPDRVGTVASAVLVELKKARLKFAPLNSGHEGWAGIQEELDELWDEVKRDDLTAARRKAVQVAAMAMRFIIDLEDGGNPAEREASR